MLELAGGRKRVETLSKKFFSKHSEQTFNITRTVNFTRGREHGLKLEDDSCTVKEVANGSQANDEGVLAGWKIIRLVSNGAILTKAFQDVLNDINRETTVIFGIPKTFEDLNELENSSLEINIRFIVTRLYNCNIIGETFEADLFVEFMWLAPWDVPTWKEYVETIEKYSGYKDLMKQLRLADWNKVDTKPFKRPANREEEVHYSEKVVQNFDGQAELKGISSFKPTWKPRISFSNMKSKHYDEMNFGSDAFSMVNISKQWYTVWRLNISNAVFYEKYELKNFPYDIQEMTINVLCTHPHTRVKLVRHKCYRSPCIVLKDEILLPEWNYLGMRCSVGDDKSGRFSKFIFQAELKRIPDYFIKSGQLVFTSITVVSFLVFGIPAEHDYIGERLTYGSTMLLTTIAFKWLLSEKIPNLPYDTYLDDYSQWCFYIQILIILVNGAMNFVRIRDENGEIDNTMVQLYDYVCFSCIFVVFFFYQLYAYFVRVPRIVKRESRRLVGMTDSMNEKVDKNYLMKVTGMSRASYFHEDFLEESVDAVSNEIQDSDSDFRGILV